MPSPELSHRYQAAVLWNALGVDAYGQTKVASPIEIRVRWNTNRTQMLDPHGRQTLLDGSIITDRKIDIGSLLWQGTLHDWYGTGSGTGGIGGDDEVVEVKAFKDVPDIKNRYTYREVGIMRFRGTIPTGSG